MTNETFMERVQQAGVSFFTWVHSFDFIWNDQAVLDAVKTTAAVATIVGTVATVFGTLATFRSRLQARLERAGPQLAFSHRS